MTGIDGMCETLHSLKRSGFALLAHDIFNLFRKSGVVAVSEYTFVPAGSDRETVKFNVVLQYALVILHFEVVDPVFSVGSRIYRSKLSAECSDKRGPIVHPAWQFIGIEDGRLKIFEGHSS